jgi:hypothetical protein
MTKPSNLRIEDVGASTARADLNDILISLASLQTTDGAGTAYTGEPTTTYPNMLWYDKATSILKVRSTDDAVWINVAYIDQSNNAFRILDDTQVVNTSGTQTGLLGDQATATWEGGTGTTESLVSPAKVKAAIDDLVPALFNATGSAPVYACRAWVNFNGTGTVAIRASGNVSSITDNGAGDYTVNFTTAMPDADYSVNVSGLGGSGDTRYFNLRSLVAGSVRVGQAGDVSVVCVSVFR